MVLPNKKRQRRKNLLPIPEFLEVGKLVRYYAKGWRVGTLREIKGNLAAVVPHGMYDEKKRHNAKLIPFCDLQRVDG